MSVRLADKKRPRIGLALSGGGIRGLSHIGVLKVLISSGIKIDFIAGTSAGAIVAALFACGYTPQQMEKMARGISPDELVDLKVTASDLFKYSIKSLLGDGSRFWAEIPSGIVKGDRLERYFKRIWGERSFQETLIPLAITAVDLYSADTVFFMTAPKQQRTILNARYCYTATLTEAVRASISLPGIFHPKKYADMLLVDGAVKNNVPTDILSHMGADFIIAVDLGYSGKPVNEMNTVGDILLQCIDIMNREVTLLKAENYADVIIRPDCGRLNFKDLKQAVGAIKCGEKAGQQSVDIIQKKLQQLA